MKRSTASRAGLLLLMSHAALAARLSVAEEGVFVKSGQALKGLGILVQNGDADLGFDNKDRAPAFSRATTASEPWPALEPEKFPVGQVASSSGLRKSARPLREPARAAAAGPNTGSAPRTGWDHATTRQRLEYVGALILGAAAGLGFAAAVGGGVVALVFLGALGAAAGAGLYNLVKGASL